MGGACCLHDTGVQKLTLNMLCPFLTSPGEGRPQHNITQATISNYVLHASNIDLHHSFLKESRLNLLLKLIVCRLEINIIEKDLKLFSNMYKMNTDSEFVITGDAHMPLGELSG